MFEKFPEFITDDPRYVDPDDSSSNINRRGQDVTFEMMEARHKTMLPKEVCEGNSILDLGSCISASGAWALESGALFYTGVEISDDNYDSAYFNMRELPEGVQETPPETTRGTQDVPRGTQEPPKRTQEAPKRPQD